MEITAQQETLIRINTVIEQVQVGKSTVWLWVKQGKFPKPLKLSSTVSVWKQSDITEYINNKVLEAEQ